MEINIKDLSGTLMKRSWICILIAIACAAAARYYSMNYMIPTYNSTAMLYLISKEEGQSTTIADLQLGNYLAQDYKILVRSRPVAEEVIAQLELPMSSSQLISLISVYTPEDTRVLEITVSYYDRDLVKRLVDTVAKVSSERMVSIMGIEQVNIVEDGNYPYYASSPNVRQNTLLAGCGGFMATLFIIAIIYLLNDTIKNAEDVEKYLGLTMLGHIPVETAIKKKKVKQKQSKKAA